MHLKYSFIYIFKFNFLLFLVRYITKSFENFKITLFLYYSISFLFTFELDFQNCCDEHLLF
jgi:hypothetical protein